jgi:hypothetical protein
LFLTGAQSAATCSRIFLPWWWRRYVPPKRRFTQELHGATSLKTAFFIVTAMKTSSLIYDNCFKMQCNNFKKLLLMKVNTIIKYFLYQIVHL